jgi:hypothetical protein
VNDHHGQDGCSNSLLCLFPRAIPRSFAVVRAIASSSIGLRLSHGLFVCLYVCLYNFVVRIVLHTADVGWSCDRFGAFEGHYANQTQYTIYTVQVQYCFY